jgi:membrane protease YdiL (CAAX protease family)
VGTFFEVLVLFGAGEAIYRMMKPHDVALEKTLVPVGLRSKKTVENMAVGLALFGLHLGWVSLYYLGGRGFGFWSPLGVDNVEALSSVVPFFSALQVGFSAGLLEELTYRIVGLAAFKKVVRSFWLANLLQAMAWAFMHSNYPQEPSYARGLELTFIGFVYGAALRRYGLWACFLSHNLVDTYMGIEPLLSSSLKALQFSACLCMAPFAIMFASSWYFIRRFGFTSPDEEKDLLNRSIQPTRSATARAVTSDSPPGFIYKPLGGKTRICLALVVAIGLCFVSFSRIPMIGEHTRLTVDRDQAVKIARQYMEKQGLKMDGYSEVAWLGNPVSGDEVQYLFEKLGEAETDKLAMSPERPLWWPAVVAGQVL